MIAAIAYFGAVLGKNKKTDRLRDPFFMVETRGLEPMTSRM